MTKLRQYPEFGNSGSNLCCTRFRNLSYIRVRDNDAGAAIGSQPAGTVWVVVDGGTKNDIARRIYSAKTGGVPTFGDETITFNDSKGYPRQSTSVVHLSKRFISKVLSSAVLVLTSAQTMLLHSFNKLLLITSIPCSQVNQLFGQTCLPLMTATMFIEVDSLFFGLAANL